MKATGTVQPYEKELFRKNGDRVPVLIGAAAFDERRHQGVAFVLDLTERRHAEAAFREMQIELAHANRVATMGQLTASIAHEVNQPLSGITARASAALRWLTAEPPHVDKARAALMQIVEAGHRAGDIVTSVRAMFRKDAPEKSSIDINNLIQSVLAIVRVDLQKNNVELETQLYHPLPPIEGDSVQLQQVVVNLVMNAIEAMHSAHPRVLKVQTEQSRPSAVRVSIEDSGTGIDRTDLDQIFKPLFTTKARGMGMGLSICKSIIESHDGQIWVSPGTNQGSIFHFELPTRVDKSSEGTNAA
jgi:C4-dicarboxylate-specific signal transduction histidine kinase